MRTRPGSKPSAIASGPTEVKAFFDRTGPASSRSRSTEADREAGYFWDLSMRQVEVSRTLVFDDPRRARRFFEALVADNVDVGRPEEVSVIFARQVTQDHQGALCAPGSSSPGTEVKMDFRYKHSRVKQYLKEGRALRIETVINKA